MRNADGTVRARVDLLWVSMIVILTCLIGFRFEVGGDWKAYLSNLDNMEKYSYAWVFSQVEFSHWFLNKLVYEFGLSITAVNLVYGFIFSTGLVVFSRVQPRPWLAFACAVPYLVIVVAMGYSRQGVAIGLALIGLVALRRERFKSFVFWICVAATFHNTALFLLSVAVFAVKKGKYIKLLAIGIISIVLYRFFLETKLNQLLYTYVIDTDSTSEGALIRLSMNAIAAIIFLWYKSVFILTPDERKLWTIISWSSLLFLVAYFLTGLSTALDRLALYLIPLQLVTAAHFPDAYGSAGKRNNGLSFLILLYFFVVQFIWLNFATHSVYWLPYQVGLVK